jgi:hypothetical protein
MSTPEHTPSTEPSTTLARTFRVRRDDDDLDSLADEVVALLLAGAIVDLSRYDRRADTIELRVIAETTGEPTT